MLHPSHATLCPKLAMPILSKGNRQLIRITSVAKWGESKLLCMWEEGVRRFNQGRVIWFRRFEMMEHCDSMLDSEKNNTSDEL